MNKVVFIGNFSGGSFGRAGDPSRTYPYFALTGDLEAEAASRESAGLIAFRDRAAAEARLAALRQRTATEASGSPRLRSVRAKKLALGKAVRAAVEAHVGAAVRAFRWGEQLPPRRPLCRESVTLLRAYPDGGWDARADGRAFRVWVGTPVRAALVVELAPV